MVIRFDHNFWYNILNFLGKSASLFPDTRAWGGVKGRLECLRKFIRFTKYTRTHKNIKLRSGTAHLHIAFSLVLSSQLKCAILCSGEKLSNSDASTCTSIRANLIVGLMWGPPQGGARCHTQLYQLFQTIHSPLTLKLTSLLTT